MFKRKFNLSKFCSRLLKLFKFIENYEICIQELREFS